MNKQHVNKLLPLATETLRRLSDDQVAQAAGASFDTRSSKSPDLLLRSHASGLRFRPSEPTSP